MKYTVLFWSLAVFLVLTACSSSRPEPESESGFLMSSKPYARYWWFASEIEEEDVRYNLNWLKDHGFGGVELAFVYPLNAFDKADTSYIPRQDWGSPEWMAIVDYSIRYADSIGLACDLTYGTLWPFGDREVRYDQGTRRFGDEHWRQIITKSWEYPRSAYVVDHLTPGNYLPYFSRMMKILPKPEVDHPQSYFIDSWEVETEKLWSEGFRDDFIKKYAYDIVPFMDSIYEAGYEHYLFDYMNLVSAKVLKFYADFDSVLNGNGIRSRGQVSGAPCDLISGYARLDIPEGEAMLYEPEFSAIPAAAALLGQKRVVSAETFTCLYGWPRDYLREEQTADLKLVADALFANGINHIIWHGKAHNPAGSDSVSFYASVHLGKNGSLSKDLTEFNQYLSSVCAWMRKGHTYSDIAVYLPTEDAWIAGRMPKEMQFKWAWGHYEMRYVYFPLELRPYSPTWINKEFLNMAVVEDHCLKVGHACYKALYVDADYLEYELLVRLAELADRGLRIIVKQLPREPGINKHPGYNEQLVALMEHQNLFTSVPEKILPLISGDSLPPYWCREDGNSLLIFFANPDSRGLKFPVEYGQSQNNNVRKREVLIRYRGHSIPLELVFEPYQSLLYRIEGGKVSSIDIEFVPERPLVKLRPENYKAPWLAE